jgi:hypothetical protein
MDALRLYIDDDNNDLWIFFSDDYSSHIGGPFLYCFDSRTLKFKRDVKLYNDKGTPVTSPHDPLFVTRDQQGNFVLATDLAYLTKVDAQGKRIYRKRLMRHDCRWTSRNTKRKKFYFIRDIKKHGDYRDRLDYRKKNIHSLYLMSMAYSVSRDLLFFGQGCHCCSKDILVCNGLGEYLYHFRSPVGPEDMAARDGLLYLADNFHALIHVFTYEGKWLRSLDVLLKNRIQGVIEPEIDMFQQQWNTDGLLHAEDEDQVASLCVIGEDKLAVGLAKGLIRILDQEGNHLFDIQPPAPGFYPKSMVADASENLFVYYTGDSCFSKPRGLYRYGANGKVKGPLFGGVLGIFKPEQKALEKKIAEDRADACDYFDLADILIRRKKPLREAIGLLEKSLELNPDLWIALAYLGLSLKELGETEKAVNCMERAMEHMGCSNMATALMEYYYRKHDQEKVWQYFQRMEDLEEDVDVEFYSEELTNGQIEEFLGALVKRNNSNNLVSN